MSIGSRACQDRKQKLSRGANIPAEIARGAARSGLRALNMSRDDVFRPMSADWWANLDHTVEHWVLRSMLQRHEVTLLTEPYDDRSMLGKFVWAQRWWPGTQLRFAHLKCLFAGPDQILVDDNDRHVDQWNQRGGIGILIPRQWNSGWRTPNTVPALMRLAAYLT